MCTFKILRGLLYLKKVLGKLNDLEEMAQFQDAYGNHRVQAKKKCKFVKHIFCMF